MKDQERLIKEIKVLSDSIRKKNRRLKMGISQRDDFIESTFNPIIKPLKEISKKLDNTSKNEADLIMPIKKFKKEEKEEEHLDVKTMPVKDIDEKYANEEEEEDYEEEDDEEDDNDDDGPSGESNLTVLGKEIAAHGELYKKYVLKMLHGTEASRRYHVFGARLEKNGLMVGNKQLVVDESDSMTVGGKTYPATIGLFELIFKKLPSRYTAQDLKWFKDICLSTNMHKKGYLSTGLLHRNTTKKYKNIISKLFPLKSGSGVKFKNMKETNIIYYNNINKLIERLKLLHEAQQAGHTGLYNEIVSLTEELRQRGYIE